MRGFHIRVAENLLYLIDRPSLIHQKTSIAMAQAMHAHIFNSGSLAYPIPSVIDIHVGQLGFGIEEDVLYARNPLNTTQHRYSAI